MSAPGLYLHVPFCSTVCPYCDFSVLKAGVPARKRFVEHLVTEVALAAREWRDPGPFDTVYFGGERLRCFRRTTSFSCWAHAARTFLSRRPGSSWRPALRT
jgi:coproporphyrinogen III oxidase-like Fe-S oxidoreductase